MSYKEFVDQIEKEKEDEFKKRLDFVLKYLKEGMSIKDSLILAEVSEEEFEEYKEKNPRFHQLVLRKQAEYKRDVVLAINEGIKNRDPRLGMVIAESKYPEEFSKKRKNDDEGKNSITNVINLIQRGEHGEQVLPKNAEKEAKVVSAVFEPEDPNNFINPPKEQDDE